MTIQHIHSFSWEQGNNTISTRKTYDGEQEINSDVTIPDSTTDMEVTFALDVSAVKAIVVTADQNITIRTNENSGGSPDDTLAVKAGDPLRWGVDHPVALFFTADITKLYVSNASGAAAALKIRALVDATP